MLRNQDQADRPKALVLIISICQLSCIVNHGTKGKVVQESIT